MEKEGLKPFLRLRSALRPNRMSSGLVPEMNTSFGPRIDAERWDFHDGIDLPALRGRPIHAMADGVASCRAGG